MRELRRVEQKHVAYVEEQEEYVRYLEQCPRRCRLCSEREEQLEEAERHRDAVEREGIAVQARPKGWLVHRVGELEVELRGLRHRHGIMVSGEAEMRRRMGEALELEIWIILSTLLPLWLHHH